MDVPLLRVLIVAAHPDDEFIGCAGTMSNAIGRNGAVRVIHLTDGGGANAGDRRNEAVAALDAFGIPSQTVFYGLPDAGLVTLVPAERSEAIERIAAAIREFEPDTVLAPWSRDPQTDHVAAGEMANEAITVASREVAFATYEVWLPTPETATNASTTNETATITIDVELDDRCIEEKRRAILAHIAQSTHPASADPTGFRITTALMERWIRPIERLHFRTRT